jgi:hypothetical protein
LASWAQRFGPYREEALFYVGFAWPTLRRLALKLGARLTAGGVLASPDDVFFLQTAEIEAASAARGAGAARADLARLARERRTLREARKRLHPPAAVPPDFRFKIGPIDASIFETQRRNLDPGAVLHGFAVSPGRVTAAASVVRSPADFEAMQPGSILVCPTTTPAWTPLFGHPRPGDRHRRHPGARLHCRPGIRDSSRDGHGQRHAADHAWPRDHGRRGRRNSDALGSGRRQPGYIGALFSHLQEELYPLWRHCAVGLREGRAPWDRTFPPRGAAAGPGAACRAMRSPCRCAGAAMLLDGYAHDYLETV